MIEILETNVDDATGESSRMLYRDFWKQGSDAMCNPVIMKKGRPGYLMKVISKSHDHRFIEILSLGTLGIRHMQNIHRSILERRRGLFSLLQKYGATMVNDWNKNKIRIDSFINGKCRHQHW